MTTPAPQTQGFMANFIDTCLLHIYVLFAVVERSLSVYPSFCYHTTVFADIIPLRVKETCLDR